MRLINCLFIAFLIFIVACDPSSDFRKVLQNNTAQDLWIISYQKINSQMTAKDSVLAKANTLNVLFTGSGIGGYWTNKDCSNPYNVDSIGVKFISNSTLKLAFDINDKTKWSYSEKGNNMKGYKIQCLLQINSADIIPK